MGTIPASENEFPSLLFAEGAAPATPAAGLVICYAKADGLIYCKDDAGTETAMGALPDHLADTSDAHDASAISVLDTAAVFTATNVETALKELYDAIGAGGIPATIIDAAGDLIVGTAADTAARLAIGATNGMVLMRVSGSLAWALPQGHEFDYAEVTSGTSVTATAEASANTVVSGNAVTYDGSTRIHVQVFCPSILPDLGASQRSILFWLFDGSSSIGRIGAAVTPAAANMHVPFTGARLLTPSNASHTYSLRATVSAGTGTASAGAGGAGNVMPAYIRIVKA